MESCKAHFWLYRGYRPCCSIIHNCTSWPMMKHKLAKFWQEENCNIWKVNHRKIRFYYVCTLPATWRWLEMRTADVCMWVWTSEDNDLHITFQCKGEKKIMWLMLVKLEHLQNVECYRYLFVQHDFGTTYCESN